MKLIKMTALMNSGIKKPDDVDMKDEILARSSLYVPGHQGFY